MLLVSIIIPVYNREKYIEKTLLSVLKQPTFDYEIIIINDGSIDKSLQICEMYCKRKMKKPYYQSTTLIIIRAVIN